MRAQGIGVQQASFYISWSEEYENQGNSRTADSVYQEGFKRGAEPLEKLLQFHKYGSTLIIFFTGSTSMLFEVVLVFLP